jgi:hypothetical protein
MERLTMIRTNAKSPAQQRIVEAYVKAAGGDPEFADATITFDTVSRMVHVTDDERDIKMKYNQAEAYFTSGFRDDDDVAADEFPDEPAKPVAVAPASRPLRAQPKPAKGKAGKSVPVTGTSAPASAAGEATTKPRRGRPQTVTSAYVEDTSGPASADAARIDAARKRLNAVVDELLSDINQERTGELDKNAARYAKGMRLSAFESIGRELKEAGDPDFQVRGAVLNYARRALHVRDVSEHAIDTRKRLAPSEVSMTRKVYETYLQHRGDLEASFEVVDAVNQETGEPLVSDSGEPYVKSVAEIALNKLYILAPYYVDTHRDKILSFAYRNSEKAVGAAVKLMDERKDNIGEVIDQLNQITNTDAGEDIDPEMAVRDFVATKVGTTPPSQVRTIKVDAAWYEGDWVDIKRVATALAVKFGHPLDDRGQIPNTVLLEHLVSYFVPREHGASAIVQAFVDNGTLEEAQARTFLAEYSGIADASVGASGADDVDDDDDGDQEEGDE